MRCVYTFLAYLMVGVLCEGPVLSRSTRWDRYWFRSPHSMYSVTIQRGSLLTHTPSRRMMLGSFRRDRIFTSFRKSFLPWGEGRVKCIREKRRRCNSQTVQHADSGPNVKINPLNQQPLGGFPPPSICFAGQYVCVAPAPTNLWTAPLST